MSRERVSVWCLAVSLARRLRAYSKQLVIGLFRVTSLGSEGHSLTVLRKSSAPPALRGTQNLE